MLQSQQFIIFFATIFTTRSSHVFITRILYSTKTHLASVNMEIHQVLTQQRIFRPFVYKISTNFSCSMCLFEEWIQKNIHGLQYGFMFSTNGRFENVCMAKLHLCAMQWMPMKMGHVFLWNVLSPYLQTLKYNHIIHAKATQLRNQLNNPPKVATNLTCILVWLSNPPPSMTLCILKNKGTLLQFLTT
jgi:hypothetical protein